LSRLLVVDDDIQMLSALEAALRRKGHTVETASNGIDAASKLENTSVQAVITDLRMPGMDGLDLLRHVRRPLLVIWDGLPGHRSHDVRDFVRAQGDRLTLEFLPGYAPELNPVEHIWSHLKQHELANLCPRELWQLSAAARGALRRMRRRPTLVCAFWKQAGLFDERH